MSDLRDSFRRIAAQQSRDRLVVLGAAASGGWLVLVVLFYLMGDSSDGASSGVSRLMALMGLLMPLALIWIAVALGRSIAALRLEAIQLRTTLDILRKGGEIVPGDTIPAVPAIRHVPSAPRAGNPPRRAAGNGGAENGQGSFDLDNPPPLELDEYELIAALNFPDGPDDIEAIDALRKALADPDLARLIRAAQDVVTLLANRGVYMDDLYAAEPDPALWRKFCAGSRGASVGDLALDVDGKTLDMASGLLRFDEVFRDAAHHFLRHFDKLITRAAPELDDRLLLALTYTRSGRAFTLLAQVAGMVGNYVPQDAPDA